MMKPDVPGPLWGDPIGPWRDWFAWRPVYSFDGECLWLRRVKRRRHQLKQHLPGPDAQWWVYALPGDLGDAK